MIVALMVACLIAAEPAPDEAAILKTFRDEFIAITPGEGKYPSEVRIGDGASPDKTIAVKLTKPFAFAKYEVTQELWQAVMGANPSRWKGPRNSVEMLGRNDAENFCRRVTKRLREAKLIDDTQLVRLPTEAEWEYCARAGTTTRYSFGDEIAQLDKHAWHTGNAAGNDPPVGAKAPNPWGLYDMHGYLWEICADDWTDDVTQLPADGKPRSALAYSEPQPGVIRGGSWKDGPEQLTSFARRQLGPDERDDAVGLRCVLVTQP